MSHIRSVVTLMSILLPLGAFFFNPFLSVLLGLFVTILSTITWRFWGGLLAASWSSLIILLSVFFSRTSLNMTELIWIIVGYLTVGIGLWIILDRKKKQRERLDSILQSTATGTWEWNSQDGDLVLNKTYTQILGYDQRELHPITTQTWDQIIHPLDRKKREEALENYLEGKTSDYSSQYRMKHKRGDWIYIQEDGTVISKTKEGKPHWIFGTIQDITELKQLEERVFAMEEDSQKKFLRMLDNIPAGIAMIDPASHEILFKNQYMKKYGGAIEGETYTKSLPINGKEFGAFFANAMDREKGVYSRELKNERNNRWYECRSSLFQWIDKRQVLLELAFDITEWKKTQAAIKESEEEKGLILDNVSEIIAFHDKNHHLIWANKAYVEGICLITQKRLTLENLKGNKCYEAWGMKNLCNNCPVSLAMKTQKPQEGELTPENQKNWPTTQGSWLIRATPVKDSSGSVIGAIEIANNITQQKKDQKKIVDYTRKLEELYQDLQKEIQKANRIHSHILPASFPEIPGIKIAAYYQPARRIGGDFYDVIKTKKRLILYLSDVAGHGLDSALLSYFIKHTIRNFIIFSPEDSLTPSRILRHLAYRFNAEEYPSEYYICIFLGILDLERKELKYTGSGFQDTPMVSLENGVEEKLQTRELFISPLLSLDSYRFQEQRIFLNQRASLFFNTDGLTEAGKPGSFYRKRLEKIFYENAHRPAQEIASIVKKDFQAFNNGSLQGKDDITFLVLQLDETKEK